MTALYNEIDKAAAAVLREQIASGVIAPGVVDTRSIKEIQPHELEGFTQIHLFAGGGLWSVAARLAGWPDDRPIWTGSCPCQPFSQAGKQAGTDDPRHLWPDFHRLVRARRPPVLMGEQVAGALGYGWLDGVRADLEGEDYACRSVDIPACAVDSPQIRNRLYWIAVADAVRAGRDASPHASPHASLYGEQEGARPRHVESERLYGPHGDGDMADPPDSKAGRRRLHRSSSSSSTDNQRTSGEFARPDGRDGNVADPGHKSGGWFRTQRGPDRRGLFGPGDDAGECRGVDQVDPSGIGRREGQPEPEFRRGRPAASGADASVCDLGDGDNPGSQGFPIAERFEGTASRRSDAQRADRGDGGCAEDVADTEGIGSSSGDARAPSRYAEPQWSPKQPQRCPDGRNGSFWSSAVWIDCHDQKKRRAEPSIPLLVDGFPGRVDLWRLAGNAINVELAAEVIRAYLETEGA